MFVGKNFLPVDDQSQFEVSVRADEGTSLQATTVLMERIATDIRKLEGVTDTLDDGRRRTSRRRKCGNNLRKINGVERPCKIAGTIDDRSARNFDRKILRKICELRFSQFRHFPAADFEMRMYSLLSVDLI